MSRAKRYTKEQKHLIKQCMIDADIMGLGKLETIAYVKGRLGLEDNKEDDDKSSFSEFSYNKYRKEALSDDTNVQWITYYARQGFVEFYRKRISEMEMIQKETFKQWLVETNRPDSQKDKRLILDLVAELRANNQHLASLGMVTPIIATIKNIIDKDKIDNASNNNIIHHQHHVQYQDSAEENIDTTEPEDNTSNNDATRSTAERNINRKF